MQAFVFERSEEAFDVRIAIGRVWWNADVGDACAGQYVVKACLAKFATAVVDQVRDAMLRKEPSIDHGQVRATCCMTTASGLAVTENRWTLRVATIMATPT